MPVESRRAGRSISEARGTVYYLDVEAIRFFRVVVPGNQPVIEKDNAFQSRVAEYGFSHLLRKEEARSPVGKFSASSSP